MSELAEVDEGFAELEQLAAGQATPSINVRFFSEPMEDEQATKAVGKRVFRDVEMIEKRIPGDKDIVRREAKEKDKREYAAHYLAFKRGQSQESAAGFPLRQWTMCTRSEAETLAAAGVRTVEQLAGAPSDNIKHVGPYTSLQQKAKDWLNQEKSGAEMAKIRAENDDLRTRVETMERMISTQSKEIEAARNGQPLATAAPVADPRLAALEAQIAALAAAVQRAPDATPFREGEAVRVGSVDVAIGRKPRGRPVGSKNKQKAPVQEN